jgi:hypothetical protein
MSVVTHLNQPTALAAPSSFPEVWKPLEVEIRAFHKALPRLLEEGEAGRFVVLKGTEALTVWDTYRDALQYGRERFGTGPFLVQKINPQDVDRLAPFLSGDGNFCP